MSVSITKSSSKRIWLLLVTAWSVVFLSAMAADFGARVLQEEGEGAPEVSQDLVGHWRFTKMVFENPRDEHLVLHADEPPRLVRDRGRTQRDYHRELECRRRHAYAFVRRRPGSFPSVHLLRRGFGFAEHSESAQDLGTNRIGRTRALLLPGAQPAKRLRTARQEPASCGRQFICPSPSHRTCRPRDQPRPRGNDILPLAWEKMPQIPTCKTTLLLASKFEPPAPFDHEMHCKSTPHMALGSERSRRQVRKGIRG